ncbi:MAG: TadE/TadG family type IV pilus assembly protein [Bacilli bacterium]
MHNNRGQTLVIFVLFLPIIILFIAYVLDVTNANYEKNRMQNLANMALESSKEFDEENIKNIISKNDEDIDVDVKEENDKVQIKMVKRVKTIFGKIIGRDYYDVTVVIEK